MNKVMIVEDDPMVAEFNKRYLEKIDDFELVATCSSVDEAIFILNEKKVELILLDIFMPGKNGLELLSYIRENDMKVDVIVISAASDTERIQKALRLGAVDYLIKPFEFERFSAALTAYYKKNTFLQSADHINQEQLDERILHNEEKALPEELPKGLSQDTLKLVWDAVQEMKSHSFSTEEIVNITGISRVSVRKYLKFLKHIDVVDVKVHYGNIGRPISQHKINESKTHHIQQYL
ncbi:response regulator [Priestia koreensis]|uniref:response regulator n=1 Tax=Priestia koreensis TaxID=284581 RepID=UPI001F59C175|nr:response regulator [Priestia koreensis]UNL85435.1 response regulator [Priestia koreensis]